MLTQSLRVPDAPWAISVPDEGFAPGFREMPGLESARGSGKIELGEVLLS